MADVRLDRSRWLGYRWHRHGLAGDPGAAATDDLLLLGVQDTGPAGVAPALAAREITGRTVVVWSVRGAPPTHRPAHLDVVRDALAPVPADAGGAEHVAAVGEVAAALTAVVTEPMTKGEASTAVTTRLPGRAAWCASCGADHVPDGLFRDAGRQAQLAVGRTARRATTLAPAPKHAHRGVDEPRLALLAAFLRVNGPVATATHKDWLGGATDVRGPWGRLADVVRVAVDGKRLGLPAALLDDVTAASPARGAALVPGHDPYLRQTDRTLLVPDAGRRKEVWKAVSPPGALLVAGEVAGTWRLRDGTLTITPFEPVGPAVRKSAEAAAPAVTGIDDPEVTWA